MTLKTLDVIRKRLGERPEELKKAKISGKKIIGWCGYNIPEEIIYALGFIPVRIAAGGDDRLVELGARYISTKNCVFLREVIGLFVENKDPYIRNIEYFAFDGTCIQNFRASEIVEYYFDKKVTVLGVPRNFYLDEAKQYFFKELKNFTQKLEEIVGKNLDHESLEKSVNLYDEIRKSIQKIYIYQSSKKELISWEEVYDVVHAGYYLDRKEYLSLLEKLIEELKNAEKEPVIQEKENEARILISGSIIPPGDKKLINIIKQAGGRIVGDDLWSGLAPYLDVNINDISIEGIAIAYLNRIPHAALPYLELENDRRLKKLNELIDYFKAQGVIYHTLRYCDPYTFKAKETKDILKNRSIPLLEIHTEYAGSDYEAIRTRVEAFVEMIKYNNI